MEVNANEFCHRTTPETFQFPSEIQPLPATATQNTNRRMPELSRTAGKPKTMRFVADGEPRRLITCAVRPRLSASAGMHLYLAVRVVTD